MTSYYDALGVGVEADLEEIRRAYYRKAQVLRPDRFGGSSPAEQQRAETEMKAVNAAWTTLRNPEARRRHDMELGLIDGDREDEATDDEGVLEAEPQLRQPTFRRGIPLVIALLLLAGIMASGIAMVFQADNPSPRWSANATAELHSAAINAGMTPPQADCFVKAITGRYGPTDDVDRAVIQGIADACR